MLSSRLHTKCWTHWKLRTVPFPSRNRVSWTFSRSVLWNHWACHNRWQSWLWSCITSLHLRLTALEGHRLHIDKWVLHCKGQNLLSRQRSGKGTFSLVPSWIHFHPDKTVKNGYVHDRSCFSFIYVPFEDTTAFDIRQNICLHYHPNIFHFRDGLPLWKAERLQRPNSLVQ